MNAIYVYFQTITGAMSVLNPPVPLENPKDQFRVDYIQNDAMATDFSYPPVSSLIGHVYITSSTVGNI